MKKLLYIALVSLSVNAFAQDEDMTTTTEETTSASPVVSKNGHQLTPVAGDIGLGMDAGQFLSFLGNSMNNTNNQAGPQVSGINQTLQVKYFLSDDMAVRVRGVINQSVSTSLFSVRADKQTDPNVYVQDRRDTETSQFSLAAGVEMRRGNGRVQGYYGGEVFFTRGVAKQIFQYGNEMRADNQAPTTFVGANQNRLLYNYGGTTVNIGVNALIGVEYFIAPRISLAGEFMVGFFYGSTSEGLQGVQEWSDDSQILTTPEIIETPTFQQKNRGLQSAPSGSVMANFYF